MIKMLLKRLVLASTLAAAFVFSGPASAQERAFIWQDGIMTNLGTLPGFDNSLARGINDSGQVVGWSYNNYQENRATLWSDGAIIDLGTLPGFSYSNAYAINNSGQVVGSTPGYHPRPVLWSNGAIIDLGALPDPYNPTGAEAIAINDNGQIVGWSDPGFRPVLWSGGEIINLGTLPGFSYNTAYGINNNGQVVGVSVDDIPFENHAMLWNHGEIIDLGMLPGAKESSATAIDENGLIVGSSTFWDKDNYENSYRVRATLWNNGEIVDIGSLFGWDNSVASDINDNGQVVGMSNINYSLRCCGVGGGGGLATLWSEGEIIDLGTLPGGDRSQAYGINNSGQVVGVSSIPVPAAVYLMSSGLAALFAASRRKNRMDAES